MSNYPFKEEKLEQQKKENARVAVKDAKRLFAILIAVGLSLGAIAAFGVVKLLDRLDLTDEPSTLPRE